MRSVVFDVHGEPAPKGSRTIGMRKNGTVYTRPSSPREKAWTETVAKACVGVARLDPPYEVDLRFRITSPKSPKYLYPSRLDLDKLVRGTLDGLTNGQIIEDDRHVVRLTAQKEYGTEGCRVTVRSLSK